MFKTKPEIGLELTRSACEPSRRPGDIRCGLRPRRQAASGGDRNWGSLCGRHPAAYLGVETVFPLFGGEETAGRDTAGVMVKIAPAAAFMMRQVRPPAWAPDSSARCTNAILQHRPDRRTAHCAARSIAGRDSRSNQRGQWDGAELERKSAASGGFGRLFIGFLCISCTDGESWMSGTTLASCESRARAWDRGGARGGTCDQASVWSIEGTARVIRPARMPMLGWFHGRV